MTRIREFEAITRQVRVYAGGWAESEAERRAGARGRGAGRLPRPLHGPRTASSSARRRKREWRPARHTAGAQEEEDEGRAQRSSRVGAGARGEAVGPWRLELDLDAASRPGAIVARLERAVVAPRAAFAPRPGRPRDRVAATGVALAGRRTASGKTTLLAVALLGRAAAGCGRAGGWAASVVLGELDQARAAFAGDRRAARGVHRRHRTDPGAQVRIAAGEVRPRRRPRRPRRRGRCSPGERTRAVLARLRGRGRATAWCSTSRPTTSTSRRSSSSSGPRRRATARLAARQRTTGRFLDAFEATVTFDLGVRTCGEGRARWHAKDGRGERSRSSASSQPPRAPWRHPARLHRRAGSEVRRDDPRDVERRTCPAPTSA